MISIITKEYKMSHYINSTVSQCYGSATLDSEECNPLAETLYPPIFMVFSVIVHFTDSVII